jgi:hypothetical protein
MLGWKPGRSGLTSGDWGVAYELEDGTVRYVSERGRVLRHSKETAEADARAMNESLAVAEAKNDPFLVSESGAFGTYSSHLRSEPGAKASRVLRVEARQLTRATLIANDRVENFYAPLLVLLDAASGELFALSNAYPLLTDPLRFSESVTNWQRGGWAVPRLHTSVLRSDAEFDSFVVNAFRLNMNVVIDPILDATGEPLTGFLVRDFDATIRAAREQSES